MLELGRQRGYTLLELMVTLGIVGILAGVAAPSFSDFVRTQQLRSVANDLATSFQLARSEAVKRNADITVARVGSSWLEGWTVAAGATTLRAHDVISGLTIIGSANSFIFRNNGRIDSAVTFSLASAADASVAKCVRLSLSGSTITDDGAC
jgi:type IV fimbrial biogenesis protein FimT